MEMTVLGIDIGTSSVKAVLIKENTVIEEHSEPTNAQIASEVEGGDEQNVQKIFDTLERVLQKFPTELLKSVSRLGICGQMHGVVLWKDNVKLSEKGQINVASDVSSLITWQDNRKFLSYTAESLCSGYGCTSIYWLYKYQPHILAYYTRAGTIMDLLVYILCNNDDVIMTSHNAYSWGCFDIESNQWEVSELEGFPVRLLPKVVTPPSLAGTLIRDWCGIPAGTALGVAMGDLQCSVLAAQPQLYDAVLNIGSAAQLSVIGSTAVNNLPAAVTKVPYFHGNTLLVAAALTGGNVIARFVDFLNEFLIGVGISTVSNDIIYQYLIDSAKSKLHTSLQICPLFLGERHRSNVRGHVTNISSDNISVGDISSALMRGVVTNLKEMMELKKFISNRVWLHIKNSVLVKLVEEGLELPVVLRPSAGSPLGAAVAVSEMEI